MSKENPVFPFKSIDDMSFYLEKDDYDPMDGYKDDEHLDTINNHIKSDILDKNKNLTPARLNSLLVRLEKKYNWY